MANEEQVEGWDFLHSRLYNPVTVIGRLKPGATVQQATENLNAIAAELAREYPATDREQSARLIRPGLEGDRRQAIHGFLFSVSALALLPAASCSATSDRDRTGVAAWRGRRHDVRRRFRRDARWLSIPPD
jgi:hypothetical protein